MIFIIYTSHTTCMCQIKALSFCPENLFIIIIIIIIIIMIITNIYSG